MVNQVLQKEFFQDKALPRETDPSTLAAVRKKVMVTSMGRQWQRQRQWQRHRQSQVKALDAYRQIFFAQIIETTDEELTSHQMDDVFQSVGHSGVKPAPNDVLLKLHKVLDLVLCSGMCQNRHP